MSIINENQLVYDSLHRVAGLMAVAARTAPKARGIGNITVCIVVGEEIQHLAEKMKQLSVEWQMPFYNRDAANIGQCPLVLLIGTRINPIGLNHCGLCGHENCDTKRRFPDVPCAFNTGDLGIAIGSAVSVAANHRVDCRVMFSAGKAAKALNLMGDETKIVYAIPLSVSSKSPFFDRQQ